MWTPDGVLVEEQLELLDDDAAAERLTHLQSVELVQAAHCSGHVTDFETCLLYTSDAADE